MCEAYSIFLPTIGPNPSKSTSHVAYLRSQQSEQSQRVYFTPQSSMDIVRHLAR